MHGAGNSFVIIECLHGEEKGEDLSDLALRLCSEKTGPGADGMIAVLPGGPEEDFSMLFYNADGSLGEMCGNGARCVARYAVEHGLSPDPGHIRFLATAGLITARRIDRERYEVRLPDPSVIDLRRLAEGEPCAYVELGDPGLPHAVVEVPMEAFDDLDALRERGRRLRHSPAFPKGANISFVCLTGESRVRAITFERGVEDFTLACGTGCGAITVSLNLPGRIPEAPLEIQMPGGLLLVSLCREGERVRDLLLTGPTAIVETGTIRNAELRGA
jgi:diaminopimelate epimerase